MSFSKIKRFLIGEPFPTSMDIHERLDKVRALAVFASDPISSNAYATEAIMSVLIVLGSQSLGLTWPLGLAVATLVLMVIFSYIQTILHYPDGGGAYTVAKDNLGEFPSLLAAAALLTDYILTVSVSVSAGVRAVTSAFPEALDYRVHMAIVAIIFITWMNLRGVRESGTVFAIPTYAFVGGVLVTILIGLARQWQLFGLPPLPVFEHSVAATASPIGFAYVWLLLRAFSGGCTALTGIEAISNGVQAFKAPESRNAALTMVAMGAMAMSLFVGITFLSTHMHLVPEEAESILSQMTRAISGRGVLYFWVQLFTAAILFLAANTAYQDFPRLSSFLSKDRFMPRWMQNRGDRLVFSYGIAVLAFIASLIVVLFKADEIAMLPLYALGVMLSFSISQTGMFRLMGKIAHLKPGEKRPVVVCQHGLEGRPRDTIEGDHWAYHDFAVKLAERGFITFAPQNLYIFEDRFRTLQRKAYPLKKTLFSIIVPQHQQIVNWLKTNSWCDVGRVAFYGLSYGGKTAMRVPPLVKDYCLSICSADFNDWVWKNASTRSPYSYVWTGEYEIFEWNLGSTFNYAEMASLIAPRPFMVERGHFDGVAPDERVALEFAKVRHLYAAQLNLPDRCEIEWFKGPHTIHGEGTFDFLHRHLNWPKN